MTHTELRAVYQKRLSDFSSTLENIKNEINLISNMRLGAAIGMIVLFYYSFQVSALGVGVVAMLILFLYLIGRHARLFEQKEHLENLVTINAGEMKALSGDCRSFFAGNEFIDPHHSYTHDLDMFGDGSLFQYVNRAGTIGGRKRMASLLASPLQSREAIAIVQESIRDIAPRLDFRQNIQAGGIETNEQVDDVKQLLAWLKHPPVLPVQKKTFGVILVVVPILTLLALAGAIFFPVFRAVLLPLILLQWIMAAVYLKRISIFHDYISRKKNILVKYAKLLLYLEKETFSSPHLLALSQRAHEAHEKVTRLASLVRALDARSNFLMTMFVNSFLLYDLQCVFRLEKWKLVNADKLPLWLDVIPEIEVLVSFGTFAYNHPTFTYAEISESLEIRGTELAHPLIDPVERVNNTFSIGPAPAVHIVTGANMAGKSTFLRTLGVNLVLALNGAPVCASSFVSPVIGLRTGMRTADSLKDHQSYFFAELNRLKGIMDELRSNKPLLILLDEILKGTNSNDKQAGSMALVKQLLPHPCLAIIATHDLALGELENEYPEHVHNFCFEATIENDQLSFDYLLKKGLASRMNASFLMRKMGIIPG